MAGKTQIDYVLLCDRDIGDQNVSRTASPLRYPGGKSRLLELVALIMRLNDLERGHYGEPYAGGCGLALSLLYDGYVADIHINDIDPAIWAFWHSALFETKSLVSLVNTAPVTVDEWHKQRAIYFAQDDTDPVTLGFSAFFLNRTNRSGVIKEGGIIGGLDQTGKYKIDCRFNREDLSRRIERISKYKDRIHLTRFDALNFIKKSFKVMPERSLLFIDPPYFTNGSQLYANYYGPKDHGTLARQVIALDRPWIITYDDTPQIREMYKARRQFCFDISYSLHEKRVGVELLIASKGIKMPAAAKQRQVNRPQYRGQPTLLV
jgi:DNA adenine methylase